MSYARTFTTNNYADYQGLLHGLQHARERGWAPLHVIDNRNPIIQQHRTWRAPTKATLRSIFRRTISLATAIPVATWSHRYRCNNKMADHAANAGFLRDPPSKKRR